MSSRIASLLAGLLFGVGLIVSGMTDPANVRGFLDFGGAFKPSLLFVMGGAVAVHFILFRLITKRKRPVFDDRFHLPTRKDADARLLVGAALFGVGWGLGGFCPGPALTSAAAGTFVAIVFVAAMTAGMLLEHATTAKLANLESLLWKSKPSTTGRPTR